MERKIIDAKGLACPQPVVLTKQALEGFNHGEMTVIKSPWNTQLWPQ